MKLTLDQVKKAAKKGFQLKLKGKTAVFIDWANVYGWSRSLKREVEPRKLFKELKSYSEVKEINFYCGLDKHPKSKIFLDGIKRIGFNLISKEVKYIHVSLDSSHFKNLVQGIKDSITSIRSLSTKDVEKILQILSRKVLRRKCDFDIEIAVGCFGYLNEYKSFVFFSGDGDFEPLYKMLINLNKQVIVVYAPGHLGKEVWNLRQGIFKTEINNFPVFLKNVPPVSRGA